MKYLTSIKSFSVFFYTISRLKPIQVFYRIKYLIFRGTPKVFLKHNFNYDKRVFFLEKDNNLLFDYEIANFIGIKREIFKLTFTIFIMAIQFLLF